MVATIPPRYRRTGLVFASAKERPLLRPSHILNAIAGVGALVLFATVLGLGLYAYGHQDRVYQGVSVAGVDLSGMTEAEAAEALQRNYSIYMNTPITLAHDGSMYAISPNELGIRLDASASVSTAMRYGRDGSLWNRSRAWADGLISGSDVPAVVLADSRRIDAGLLALTNVVARPATNAWIDFAGKEPVVIPEILGVGYDYGLTKAMVMDRVTSRSDDSVDIAVTVLQPDVTQQTISATLPSAQTALANALVLRGLNGQSWTVDQEQLKSIVSISADGTSVGVNRDAIKRMLSSIAENVYRDPSDAVLFVNGDGEIELVPAVESVEVDVDQSVDRVSASLLDGSHDVEIVIDRNPPAITDERAMASQAEIVKTLENGITIKWDGGQQALTAADLTAALVIETAPDEKEPFTFSLSPQVLSNLVRTFAGEIEVEPHEATFRLVDGEVTAVKKGQTGNVINYDDSAARIAKAVFAGYGSSNLKVEVIEPELSTKDAAKIKLPDVLGEASTPYSSSSEARKTNVERAVDLQNGWLIAPGDEYSYVDLIGDITEDNGFVVGLGIVVDPDDPESVVTAPVIGGGICQVSTTIFQSAFWAKLAMGERWAHPYWIQSYGTGEGGMKGLDAMVNIEEEDTEWATTLDMTFINTTDNWIAVEMVADGQNVTSRILGTDPGWTIEIEGPEISNTVNPDSTPIKQDSPEIPNGEERQVETAQDGFDAEIVRIVKDKDGTVIDEYVLTSTYSATSNRILVGTGQ